jgi:hypothetical protein
VAAAVALLRVRIPSAAVEVRERGTRVRAAGVWREVLIIVAGPLLGNPVRIAAAAGDDHHDEQALRHPLRQLSCAHGCPPQYPMPVSS